MPPVSKDMRERCRPSRVSNIMRTRPFSTQYISKIPDSESSMSAPDLKESREPMALISCHTGEERSASPRISGTAKERNSEQDGKRLPPSARYFLSMPYPPPKACDGHSIEKWVSGAKGLLRICGGIFKNVACASEKYGDIPYGSHRLIFRRLP